MGRADFYAHGDPNMICDGCGQKFKKSDMREMWNHTWMCPYDWEIRHPQDFLKSRLDKQTFEDPRPEAVSVTNEWNSDTSSFDTGTNSPSQDDFLSTNEITVDDLGNGNGDISDVT